MGNVSVMLNKETLEGTATAGGVTGESHNRRGTIRDAERLPHAVRTVVKNAAKGRLRIAVLPSNSANHDHKHRLNERDLLSRASQRHVAGVPRAVVLSAAHTESTSPQYGGGSEKLAGDAAPAR